MEGEGEQAFALAAATPLAGCTFLPVAALTSRYCSSRIRSIAAGRTAPECQRQGGLLSDESRETGGLSSRRSGARGGNREKLLDGYGSSASALGAGAALLYGTVAATMGFINKVVLSVYGVRESNFLLLAQMVVTAALMLSLRTAGKVAFPPVNVAQAKRLAPVAVLYNANVAFALMSLGRVSVPTYNTLKRLTPAVVLVANRTLRLNRSRALPRQVQAFRCGHRPRMPRRGAGDLEFDLGGYLAGCVSCLLQASYLIRSSGSPAPSAASAARNSSPTTPYSPPRSSPSSPSPRANSATALDAPPSSRAKETRIPKRRLPPRFCAGALPSLTTRCSCVCTMTNSALTTTVVSVEGVASTVLIFPPRWSDRARHTRADHINTGPRQGTEGRPREGRARKVNACRPAQG